MLPRSREQAMTNFRARGASGFRYRFRAGRSAAHAHRLAMERLETRITPATIAVTGTGDTIAVDGVVTLREAISSVNGGADVNADVVAFGGAYGMADTIDFAIPGAG